MCKALPLRAYNSQDSYVELLGVHVSCRQSRGRVLYSAALALHALGLPTPRDKQDVLKACSAMQPLRSRQRLLALNGPLNYDLPELSMSDSINVLVAISATSCELLNEILLRMISPRAMATPGALLEAGTTRDEPLRIL